MMVVKRANFDIVGWLAECEECGETFSPALGQQDPETAPEYVEHEYSMERDEPCGGRGKVLGAWGK